MVVVPEIISSLEWAIQNPGATIIGAVLALTLAYFLELDVSNRRAGGDRPLPVPADQLRRIWDDRRERAVRLQAIEDIRPTLAGAAA